MKLLITKKRRADIGGKFEPQTKFSIKELAEYLRFSPSTARRTMLELELLGLVRIDKEKVGKNNNILKYYIELHPSFKWLLEKEFQDLIKVLNRRL